MLQSGERDAKQAVDISVTPPPPPPGASISHPDSSCEPRPRPRRAVHSPDVVADDPVPHRDWAAGASLASEFCRILISIGGVLGVLCAYVKSKTPNGRYLPTRRDWLAVRSARTSHRKRNASHGKPESVHICHSRRSELLDESGLHLSALCRRPWPSKARHNRNLYCYPTAPPS